MIPIRTSPATRTPRLGVTGRGVEYGAPVPIRLAAGSAQTVISDTVSDQTLTVNAGYKVVSEGDIVTIGETRWIVESVTDVPRQGPFGYSTVDLRIWVGD